MIQWEGAGLRTGCRAREIACSFHQVGVFRPKHSNFHVERDDAASRVFLEIGRSCGHCSGEDVQ